MILCLLNIVFVGDGFIGRDVYSECVLILFVKFC